MPRPDQPHASPASVPKPPGESADVKILDVQPTHRIVFPGSSYITSVGFSPDGKTAYCMVDGNGVDIWAVVAGVWPEVTGGVVGLAILSWLMILWRVRARPQVAGMPHCRKCNYNVVSQAPDVLKHGAAQVLPSAEVVCPECGVSLAKKRPVRGRGILRRLWPATALVVLIAGIYAGMLAAHLPRTLPASQAFGVWWEWIDDLAAKHQVGWLTKQNVPVHRIKVVDTATGKIVSTLRTERGFPPTDMRVAPDGGHVVYGDAQGHLLWVSTGTSFLSASTSGGTFDGHERVVAGFDGPASDPWVYYGAVSQRNKTSRLLKWRPSTREQRVVVEEPAYVMTYANGTSACVCRKYALLYWKEGTATVSSENSSEAYYLKRVSLTVRGPGEEPGRGSREIRVDSPMMSLSPLIATPDGATIFLSGMSSGIFGYDAHSGDRLGVLKPTNPESFHEKFEVSADGTRLFVSTYPTAILVRDIQRRVFVARLKIPEPFIAPDVAVSPDGRWLAATPFRSQGGPQSRGPYVHELMLFDLSVIGQPDKPAAEGDTK